MKKQLSLLKAVLSEDMNLFKQTSNGKYSKILPLILSFTLMFVIGSYVFMIARPLNEMNLTYITLTVFMIVISIFILIEGIYKSQGILFDSKDNELLFSLPISKNKIFFVRIFKLLIFQFIYNLLFLIPVFSIYIYYEFSNLSFNFYIMSIIMMFMLPIIPTIVSAVLGYLIKGISSKFKSKKMIQLVLSVIMFFGLYTLFYNMDYLVEMLTKNATSVNDFLTRLYFPVGSYIKLIERFDFILFLGFVLVNLVPLFLFVWIGAKFYLKVVTRSKEVGKSRKKYKKESLKEHTPILALTNKEIKRFFSSPIYIFNTSFGLIIFLVSIIMLAINSDGMINGMIAQEGINVSIDEIVYYIPKIYLAFVIFISFMTSITSSSISLEGKSFNITKSLPVKEKTVFISKILTSNIITIPFILLSDIIFLISFDVSFLDVVYILLASILTPTITALIGLLVNLKYPKMNASSDTEVVKQSLSVVVSVLLGLLLSLASILIAYLLSEYINLELIILIGLFIYSAMLFILWKVLKKYGVKRFREINV